MPDYSLLYSILEIRTRISWNFLSLLDFWLNNNPTNKFDFRVQSSVDNLRCTSRIIIRLTINELESR